MPKEIINYNQDLPLPAVDRLPANTPNRIVVYGSNLSGAHNTTVGFQTFLEEKGIPNPMVRQLRDISLIEDAFYYESLGQKENNPENKTLPRGVILFPEMRAYHHMTGMFVPTYESRVAYQVRTLCAENGVPLIEIHDNFSNEQIEQAIVNGLKSESTD